MKVIVITAANELKVKEYEPGLEFLQAQVGGYITPAKRAGLSEPYEMLVDEEALVIGNKGFNFLASILSGYPNDDVLKVNGKEIRLHHRIYGDAVIVKVAGSDYTGLEDQEAVELYQSLLPFVEAIPNEKGS
ncbi:MAG: DUF3846 domain-containing protein [Clostridia bacterium]|nr:DUF3846 domain-containing protein [Clostridia bacterium]